MKMLKLAVVVGLAGSTVAMFTSSAQAYNVVLSGPPALNAAIGKYVFDYSLVLGANETITSGETVTIKNFYGQTGANINPLAQNSPYNFIVSSVSSVPFVPNATGDGTGNSVTWTANPTSTFTAPAGGQTINGFQIISQLGDTFGKANLVINGGTQLTPPSPTVIAPGVNGAAVPEAKSSLAAVMALGFGYLYQRKLQKKGSFKP